MKATYIRAAVRELAGYVPGEQPRGERVVKLNTNENPYPPSPAVRAAVVQAAGDELRRYPDPLALEVRHRAAARYGVDVTQVLVGNGSDELLGLIMRACVGAGTRVAYAVPTYSLYQTLVALQEGVAVEVPYDHDWALPEALARAGATVTLVCHPNSPSGTAVPIPVIENLARESAGLVVVDEAYADFADESALVLLKDLDNLVVLRTFSKSFSLAGMRAGLAIGSAELIATLERIKDSYNVNRLSLVAAAAALDDYSWMKENVRRIRATRARLSEGLRSLGFTVLPSQANFVFARRPGEDLGPLHEQLRARGILVRYFSTPDLRDGLRITVGTDEETAVLLQALAALQRPA
jgi:histidinol-phosphate aminotransferase